MSVLPFALFLIIGHGIFYSSKVVYANDNNVESSAASTVQHVGSTVDNRDQHVNEKIQQKDDVSKRETLSGNTAMPNSTTVASSIITKTESTTSSTTKNPQTTSEATTTIRKSTTTTAATTTSTSEATTTTKKSTTTTSTTSTTTTPATTTTKKPTPSPTPQPTPKEPSVGNWNVTYDGTNRTCILIEMAVQIQVVYNISNKSYNFTENIPSNATTSGSCHVQQRQINDMKTTASQQFISLKWPNSRINDVILNFQETKTAFDLAAIEVSVVLALPDGNFTTVVMVHNNTEFSTPLRSSYKCDQIQHLNLTTESDIIPTNTSNITVSGYFDISHTQIQAFRNESGKVFGSAVDCMDSGTSDAVPAAVGCALIILIIIVLVAYLVGRRRSQGGYVSM